MADKFTLDNILDYLKLDNYYLIKNIANAINQWNEKQILTWLDWCMSRNDALIKLITKYAKAKEWFDKIKQKRI